ncbi:MAG: alpha/beta hydrolase [Chitinispirillaceae bacterium]|nr:alpha/beta hydrolase [Chitinispirillaceae bacterium]
MDNMFLFTGSNPAYFDAVDTTELYNELRDNSDIRWRIFRIPAPGVPMDCFAIQQDRLPEAVAAARVILFFSGNDVSFWNNYGEWKCLSDLDADFMTIDYRGYGRTLGKFTTSEESCYDDAQRAFSYLTDSLGYHRDSVTLVGFSLGTGVAVETAKRLKTVRQILFAPFTSIQVVANGITGGYNIPSRWLLESRFDNIRKITEIDQPLFILAGEDDMLFPPQDHAVKLYGKAEEPKHLMLIPGYDHPMFITKSFRHWRDSIVTFIGTGE